MVMKPSESKVQWGSRSDRDGEERSWDEGSSLPIVVSSQGDLAFL